MPRIHDLAARALRRRKLSEAELLKNLMRCIECAAEQLALTPEGAACGACGRRYRAWRVPSTFRPQRA